MIRLLRSKSVYSTTRLRDLGYRTASILMDMVVNYDRALPALPQTPWRFLTLALPSNQGR